ncbi:MAG: sulfotransferase [Leptospirillia bacterium]
MGNAPPQGPVFIVSTGRSGTTTLSRLLSQVEGCVCPHEPEPVLIAESSGYRYGDVSAADVAEVLAATRSASVDGKLYCESNQTLSLLIPVILQVFPHARFVWLIRNGMDVVSSAYQRQWYSGHNDVYERYEDCLPIQQAWIDGRVQGDRCGDVEASVWAAMSRFEKCCWYWGYVNRTIEADLNAHAAGRFHTLCLEELGEALPGLLAWLGFEGREPPPAQVTNVSRNEPYHWTGWSEDELAAFTRQCGPVMDARYPSWRQVVGSEGGRLFVAPFVRAVTAQLQGLDTENKALRARAEVLGADAEAFRALRRTWVWKLHRLVSKFKS